jgi:hypothetical protein
MPGRNQTGPQGLGPMTGRGAGLCTGNAVAGQGYGMGFGRGCGFGGGWRAGRDFGRGAAMRYGGYAAPYGYPAAYAQTSPDVEKQVLSGQVRALESELDRVRKRMAEIDAAPDVQ